MTDKIAVGVSACLLGQNVRFNGGNSHQAYLTKTLADYFDFKKVCPEVSAGLGVPRKPVYFQSAQQTIQVIEHDTGQDYTEKLTQTAEELIQNFPRVYGFILKKNSPSCGIGNVKIYDQNHVPIKEKADGIFVQVLKKHFPYLPIEDEGRLNDPYLREHFIKSVFLHYALDKEFLTAPDLNACIAFHTRHKMLLRLHHPELRKRLGQLLAQKNVDLHDLKVQYADLFMQAIRRVARRRQHHTVLLRIFKSINKQLTLAQRENMQKVLKKYYKGLVPLAVPMELIRHFLNVYSIPFLEIQRYINPYPDELGLMAEI